MNPSDENTPGTGTPSASEIPNLTEEIRNLIRKLDAPKRKSVWDVFPVLTTFMGTVVLAGISLYVTQSYQRQEAQRTHDYQAAEAERLKEFNKAQIEMQRAQIRVEELKALTALTPLLASPDVSTRETAKQMLQAVRASGASNPGASNPGARDTGVSIPGSANPGTTSRSNPTSVASSPTIRTTTLPSASLLDQFVDIALSSDAPAQERVAATRKIGEIAARTNSPAVRDRAAEAAAKIAISPSAPQEVKKAAADVIANIKRVTADEVRQMIQTQRITRKLTEVILHDAGIPASFYKGAQTIFGIAEFQSQLPGFGGRLGWHYAISADGAIWLGTPLNEMAIHTPRHQQTSVSIMLLLDGNKELPTDAQRSSLAVVLRALFGRLNLESSTNAPDGIGFHFHRDYNRLKTCPGQLLTKETVLSWQ